VDPAVRAGHDVAIRRIEPGEWAAWRDLRLRSLRDSPGAFGSSHEREAALELEAWRERTEALARDDDRALFVAEQGGVLVGCGGVVVPVAESSAEVFAMWVAPEARRRGVGERLLRALVAFATSRRARTIRLLVLPGNEPALRLYRRFGFRETGARRPVERDPELRGFELALPGEASPPGLRMEA
jgi:ribosomal protein S18 acetylase RimI-like enzyme